jgi:hypothetical protein
MPRASKAKCPAKPTGSPNKVSGHRYGGALRIYQGEGKAETGLPSPFLNLTMLNLTMKTRKAAA